MKVQKVLSHMTIDVETRAGRKIDPWASDLA